MEFEKAIQGEILIALRRIVRAIDLHSRRLVQEFGLTGPQIVVLRELVHKQKMHAADLARSVSLSHATVTDILNRLEKRGFISRTRSHEDRRRILVAPTEHAATLVAKSPPLLQEQFLEQLANLQPWELTQILSVLQRIALMMDAKQVEASPMLATGSVTADPEAIEIVTRPDGNTTANKLLPKENTSTQRDKEYDSAQTKTKDTVPNRTRKRRATDVSRT
ncbi:MAG: MarR family transcriptional regulator [Arenicellales bacterium]|nr:MarR family transcriptional regulator [Arenicellales bacterium]